MAELYQAQEAASGGAGAPAAQAAFAARLEAAVQTVLQVSHHFPSHLTNVGNLEPDRESQRHDPATGLMGSIQ